MSFYKKTTIIVAITIAIIVGLEYWILDKNQGIYTNPKQFNAQNTTTKSNKSFLAAPTIGAYLAGADNFSIQFPGVPIFHPGTDALGYKFDSYLYLANRQYYVIVDYTPRPSIYLIKRLESFIESSFGLVPTTPVESVTFKSYPALFGQYYSNQNKTNAYAYTFYNSSQEIVIMAQNVNQSTFEKFANSYDNLN